MKPVKRKALIFIQLILACNFIIFGYMFSSEENYRNIIISVSTIGAIGCVYETIRLYRNKE